MVHMVLKSAMILGKSEPSLYASAGQLGTFPDVDVHSCFQVMKSPLRVEKQSYSS